MKRVVFTNKTDVRLGFELECVILEKHYKQFQKEINTLKKADIDDDGSLDVDGFEENSLTAEIQTYPLKPKKAMELLKNIFIIINKYGGTNESCGLHVNISSSSKRKMKNFDPILFFSSKLWNQILKKFQREDNDYCQPFNKRRNESKISFIEKIQESIEEKYRCVTLINFNNGDCQDSRIEIRAFGNTDYTKKYQTIAGFVKRIEKLFQLSCTTYNI